MGLKEHGQYHISFDENINLHPELKQYNENYQSKNYNYMEEIRRKNIEVACKKRRELINNLLEKDKKEITKSCSSLNLKPKKIFLLDNENKKMRQLLVIKSKIKFELKLSEIEKQNKQKHLQLEKNIFGIKQFRQKLKEEKIFKEELSDLQRKEKLESDYKEYLNHQNEIKNRNQRVQNNFEKMQKQKFEDNKFKKLLSRQKEDEFKLKLEFKNLKEIENRNNKLKNLRLKFEIQKKNFEDIKKEKETEYHEKAKITEEKRIRALNSISEFSNIFNNYKRNQIELKSEKACANRIKIFNEKKEKAREKNILFLEKEKYVSNYFKKIEKDLEKKAEQFNKKYLNISLRKINLDLKNQENLKFKNLILSEKEKNFKQFRLKEQEENELNRKRLFEKITNSLSQMEQRRLKNKSDLKEKFAHLNLKMGEISQNLKRQENIRELKRIQQIEKLEEKDKKLEQLKYLKLQMQEQRRKINENIQMDKERLMDRYSLLRQSENKSNEEIIKDLFPEDCNKNENSFV